MDWVAAAIELFGSWFVGNKKRYAFVLLFLCNICWIYVAVDHKIYGLLIVVIPALFINIRNFVKWGNNDNKKKIW